MRPDLLTELRAAIPAAAVLKDVAAGISGARTAVMLDAEGRELAFVKWSVDPAAEAAAQISLEGTNLQQIACLPGTAALLYFDTALPLLATEFVPSSPTACWDEDAWSTASATLQALREVCPSGLPLVRDWKAFRDRGTATYDALLACTEDHTLSALFETCYHSFREELEHSAVCHSDTHPDNWVLSPKGPVLVDFSRLALGPEGFDETFLLAHLDAPTPERLRWLAAAVDPRVARVVAGAVVARLAVGRQGQADPWRTWCAHRWDAALSLATALS